MIYDLIVIGAGACGLSCAITASSRGKNVLVLEKEQKLGSKILVSGNGKCNLSATDVSPDKYNDPDFVAPVLAGEDPVRFFEKTGVMTRTAGKRIYPYSESALTVVTKMRACIPPETIRTEEVDTVTFSGGFYSVNNYRGKAVALCTGSAATKGTASYDLLKKFGHRVSSLRPSIVQLRTDTTFIKGLSGLRSKASVSLLSGGKKVATEEGEILFRDGGISGIAVMCLSVFVARHPDKEYELSVDFIPGAEKEAAKFCADGKADGILHKSVAQAVERYAAAKNLSLIEALADFRIKVVGLGTVSQAQVICGGILTRDFDENLQSKLSPGLYVGGEVLDVDGECGGYNLHWAVASGMRIGRSV